LKRGLLDDKQQIALLHLAARLEGNLLDESADAGANFHLLDRPHVSVVAEILGDLAALGRRHLDQRRRRRRGGLLLARTARREDAGQRDQRSAFARNTATASQPLTGMKRTGRSRSLGYAAITGHDDSFLSAG
jgi:hypothetical protein